jgi:hypothetical protein
MPSAKNRFPFTGTKQIKICHRMQRGNFILWSAIYIYIYIYIYICGHVRMRTHTHTDKRIVAHAHVHTRTRTCTLTQTPTCMLEQHARLWFLWRGLRVQCMADNFVAASWAGNAPVPIQWTYNSATGSYVPVSWAGIAAMPTQWTYNSAFGTCDNLQWQYQVAQNVPGIHSQFRAAHTYYVDGNAGNVLTQHMSKVVRKGEHEPLRKGELVFYRCKICKKCATDDHLASSAHADKVERRGEAEQKGCARLKSRMDYSRRAAELYRRAAESAGIPVRPSPKASQYVPGYHGFTRGVENRRLV